MDVHGAVITAHAATRMARREVAAADLRRVLATPDEILPVRPGRVVAHGMIGSRLLRVIVDVDRSPPEVVTVYCTSKVSKYRRPS